jgi:hypothetical protein
VFCPNLGPNMNTPIKENYRIDKYVNVKIQRGNKIKAIHYVRGGGSIQDD